MSIVVLGEKQAEPVAAAVAAWSGRTVHLMRDSAPAIRHVSHGSTTVAVDVIATTVLPDGPLDAAIVVTESRFLRAVLEPVAARLSGVPLLLAPGGFGGVLRVLRWYADWGLEPPLVAEATGFPVGGTLEGDHLTTRVHKRGMPFAAASADLTQAAHEVFGPLLPELVPSDLVTTSLSNTNHMIHPGVVLLNATRIDHGEDFIFYRDGISTAVAPLLEAVDAERVAVVERLGGERLGVRDWMLRFYGSEGMTGDDIGACLAGFDAFADVRGPQTLDYRYLVDDIPFGAAQWAVLSADLGVPTPQLDALLATLQACVPHLDLRPDAEAALLFRQFLATIQGVPA